MSAVLWRDLQIGLRNPRGWLMAVVFFLLCLSLFAIGLKGQESLMQTTAPTIIWLALIFSILLTFENVFEHDIRSGVFEQLHLSGVSSMAIVSSKILSGFLITVAPLLIAIPVAGIWYHLSLLQISAIMLSILLGGPAIIAYGVMAGAILARQKGLGFLAILMTLPFIVPVLIFALSGIESFRISGIFNSQFQALMGTSLIALALSIPASSAAINTYLD